MTISFFNKVLKIWDIVQIMLNFGLGCQFPLKMFKLITKLSSLSEMPINSKSGIPFLEVLPLGLGGAACSHPHSTLSVTQFYLICYRHLCFDKVNHKEMEHNIEILVHNIIFWIQLSLEHAYNSVLIKTFHCWLWVHMSAITIYGTSKIMIAR